ncbi:bis(5'-nucleosyl)-tetraphosphatase (symmetrical) YqeK [Egbenema bharatensis]|uniref:bis(5'-nucleosyl)-tetraphosphatase (symmetrical) YqeK n=1 Tax=Egbenema bharatensis TaxID=3463334 RepID=UPI003A84B561
MRQHVLDWLADNVPESRISHILRVEQMAVTLAQQHGLDEAKAAQAGLMHDLAKYFKPQRLLEMAQKEGLAIDPVDEANPHLLHADVSAIVARNVFGVVDEEILAAIANHTLGRPGMSAISCVVFLSDSLEPGRGDTPELNTLRQTSQHHLHQAVWMTCDYTLQHLMEKRRLIHPRAIATRNWFLQSAQHSFTHPSPEPVSASHLRP